MSDRYGTPTRPDDIPESVWNSCWWAQAHGLQEAASRHIMAAKAEEREACAKIAMSFVEKLDKVGEEQEWMERYDACIKIAMAIRSRT